MCQYSPATFAEVPPTLVTVFLLSFLDRLYFSVANSLRAAKSPFFAYLFRKARWTDDTLGTRLQLDGRTTCFAPKFNPQLLQSKVLKQTVCKRKSGDDLKNR